ncbi:MAG: arsenite methyltransferase [Actinomycetota bacterium]
MSQLDFDENVARSLEKLYATADVLRRRTIVRAAVDATEGDAILDVGCGPGFYVAELLHETGSSGRVVGIDSSPQMLAIAAKRTTGHENVEFRDGEAIALPVEDGAFDRALCVQVLEYVDDATAALNEIHRALRPSGRVVVWDVDWTTVSWHSADPGRMAAVLAAWDGHLVHPALPRTLSARLRDAGFSDIAVEGHVFATNQLSPETYGGALIRVLQDYVGGRPDAVSAEELSAWAAEQRALDEAGEFFFSVVQYCFTAARD